MAEAPARNPTRILGQILLFALILIGSYWAFQMLIRWADKKNNQQYTITIQVEGTASVAVITYTQTDGKASSPQEVRLPWHKTMRYPKGTIVVVTAANPLQMGSVTCKLLLNGQAWKKDSANSPLDKISCGGIAP